MGEVVLDKSQQSKKYRTMVGKSANYSEFTLCHCVSTQHPIHKSGVLGSIPGLATYFRFSFRFFKKGSCQLLAKVCARSTG